MKEHTYTYTNVNNILFNRKQTILKKQIKISLRFLDI